MLATTGQFYIADVSSGLATYAEVRRVADYEKKRARTYAPSRTFREPLERGEVSLSIEEMETKPSVVLGTGEQPRAREPITARRTSGRASSEPRDLVAESAKERVALLARKFAQGSLTPEEDARVAVATQRVDAAFRRAGPAAFEHLARLSERAVDGIQRTEETLRTLERLGL
jgi:hypothetical protein